jgi:peptide/nickel transport system substrate-binding protein
MKRIGLLVSILIIASFLAACGSTPAPEVVEKEVIVTEQVVETVIVGGTPQVVEKEVTTVVEVEKVVTATPEPEPMPAVGGTLVYALASEPESLDAQVATSGVATAVLTQLGASLIAKDPETGDYIPYLAESWQVADDGMSWVFTLRQDVQFHDGTPLSAHDYAWTFQRAMDPETMSAVTAAALTGVIGVEALDDYTLQINMAMPVYPLLENLSSVAFFQPLSQTAVEGAGEDYGRQPVGVGPFKFKEWVTGDKIVLERNPDFAWGPEYAQGSASYIETLEFRILPEYATRIAALEAEELDFAYLQTKDLERIQDLDRYQIVDTLSQGIGPGVYMNVSKPPFDDVRVRQALSWAVNRDVILKIVAGGYGVPQYGPLSASVKGYWPGVEYIGYTYDLAKAQALLAEAGYSLSSDGILEKDGQPLSLVLSVVSASSNYVKTAELLQEQFKDLGVQVELEQQELGVFLSGMSSGEYDFAVTGNGWPDSGLLFAMFHSSMIGALNDSRVADPELDPILIAMGFTNDAEQNEKMGNEAQKYIVEQAYIIPLYTPQNFAALSNEVRDAVILNLNGLPVPQFFDAYMETTVP